jgi:hypothetical protein
MPTARLSNDEAAIRAEPDDLPPEAAAAFLQFAFPERDRDRMHELADKNRNDSLTEAERRELDSYRRVGRLLDLLAARARRALAKHGRSA